MMNSGEQGYLDMLRNIMETGVTKMDRTGVGTKSIFGNMIRFNMSDGFPLLTTKKVFFKGIAVELLWFLRGETNIKSLVDQGVSIWSAWPHKYYNQQTKNNIDLKAFEDRIRADETFAQEWGGLGKIYGAQWRKWSKTTRTVSLKSYQDKYLYEEIDQVKKSIELLRTDPNSRRNIVMAWNPADTDEMAISGLPACHFSFQLSARPLSIQQRLDMTDKDQGDNVSENLKLTPSYKLDMLVNIRSWDTFLGGPFNIASYALLLHMYAQVVNMVPGDLVISSADTHIYSNHFKQVEEQLGRTPRPLPTLRLNPNIKSIDDFKLEDFEIVGYDPHPRIQGEVAV